MKANYCSSKYASEHQLYIFKKNFLFNNNYGPTTGLR